MNKIHKKSFKKIWKDILIRFFVDNIIIHNIVRCHRLPERSFFVDNRQFHICARCTGILTGLFVSILILPIYKQIAILFIPFFVLLVLDGTTQKFGWRESNNSLRFISGLTVGTTLLPFIISLTTYNWK